MSSPTCTVERPVKSRNWALLGTESDELSPARSQHTPLEQNHQGTGTCSLSYSGCFELAISPLFLSKEAFHPHTHFRTSVHFQVPFFFSFFFFFSFIKIHFSSGLSKLLWGFSETQRHSFQIMLLVISRRWLRMWSIWAREPVALRQELVLACKCTGACHGTAEWSRADNLWSPREDRFLFLCCIYLSL